MRIDIELYRREVTLADGVRLSVIDVEPERPLNTIVMLHGYGGNATQWRYQIAALSDLNRCIALDLRGHGRSQKPASEYTIDEMIDDILGVLEALGIEEQFVLMGHSFGGALAATLANRHPEIVERLVLAATASTFDLPWYTRLALSLPVQVLNLAAPFVRDQISAPPLVLKRYFRNGLDRWKGSGLLRSLQMPVLVIRGDRDLVFPEAVFEEVARLIPQSEEVNLNVSKHMVILERRDAVERALNRFLGTGAASWRSSKPAARRREELVARRPWIAAYEDGVPPTIAIPNKALTSLLENAAHRFARRPATIFMGSTLTFGEVNRQANQLAHALRGLGVDSSTRVMVLMPNVPQWVIAFYAVLKAGGIVVGASPVSDVAEIAREVSDSGAEVLITLSDLQAKVPQSLKHVIITHIADALGPIRRPFAPKPQPAVAGHMWRDLLKAYPTTPPAIEIDPSATALIQYTGGTTAAPKGVMLSHRALLANALQTRHWVPNVQEGRERVLCVTPFAHIYGITAAMNAALAVGATMIILPRFKTDEVLQTIKRYKPSLFPGVPSMYVAINNFPGVRRYNIEAIKFCISGAAPLPVEVQEAFEKLTKGRLVEGYGQTEASPVTHANPLTGLRKTGSIGVPLPNTEAKIVDLQTGAALPPGQIGELVVRGPQVMQGYWSMPDDSVLKDGWLHTGDVATMDTSGYFQIISRKKDMWYMRGEGSPVPAFPRDVEEVIYEIPGVEEAAVVGVGDFPVAFVTLSRDLEPGTIQGYCARRLPEELVPVLIVIVDEMPKSFVGKIIRRTLLDQIPEPQRRELDITSDRIDEMLDYPADGGQS